MHQFYTIILALEGINIQPILLNWSPRIVMLYTLLIVTINKKTGLGGKMRPVLTIFLLWESYHNFTHIHATQKLASIAPVVAPRNMFP